MEDKLNSIGDYKSRNSLVLLELENSIISGYFKNKIKDSLTGSNLENKISRRGNNDVFRIGVVGGMSLALRVPTGFNSCDIYSKLEIETYCQNASSVFDNGSDVPAFCLPVRYSKLDRCGRICESYALLTEDLTDWGRFKLEDVEGSMSRVIKNKINLSNEDCGEVYVDLGPRSYLGINVGIDCNFVFTDSKLVLDLK